MKPRIRTVKPELYTHEELYDLEKSTNLPMRFAFSGLFGICHREGRFPWRPREIKLHVLPYDDLDFSRVLDALLTRGFIVKYRVGNVWFGLIPTFTRHQLINNRESPSVLPPVDTADEVIDQRLQHVTESPEESDSRVLDACPTRHDLAQVEGNGNGNGKSLSALSSDGEKLITEQIENLYQAYPRHVGKIDATKAIRKALSKVAFEELFEAVEEYAASPEGRAGKFTPYPSTWFTKGKWNDDRNEWQRTGSNGTTGPGSGQRFPEGAQPSGGIATDF